VYDVDGIFIYGSIAFWVGVTVIFLRDLRLLPFTLRSVSLFTIIRAFFITLTHLGPFPDRVTLTSNFILNKLTFGGDLFFSGHTGLPFLMALIFWQNKVLRYSFLVASVIFGVSVILGHLHYSIDVFAAYFITYSIYHLAVLVFPGDRTLFNRSPIAKKQITL
jgi:membrane-associated phospholipid phosphatase